MTDPVSATMAMSSTQMSASGGIGLTAGGGLLGAFGKLAEGSAKSSMYQYQSGLADMRAKIALQNRDYAVQTGEDQAYRYGLKARQEQGKVIAKGGASGLDVGSGSNADVQESQRYVNKLDMATIRNNAARRAYGYEVEAATEAGQANLYSMAASNTKTASYFDATSSLISTASSVNDKWMQGRSAGLFGASTNPRSVSFYPPDDL